MEKRPTEFMAVMNLKVIPSRWLAAFWELDQLADQIVYVKSQGNSENVTSASQALVRTKTRKK